MPDYVKAGARQYGSDVGAGFFKDSAVFINQAEKYNKISK